MLFSTWRSRTVTDEQKLAWPILSEQEEPHTERLWRVLQWLFGQESRWYTLEGVSEYCHCRQLHIAQFFEFQVFWFNSCWSCWGSSVSRTVVLGRGALASLTVRVCVCVNVSFLHIDALSVWIPDFSCSTVVFLISLKRKKKRKYCKQYSNRYDIQCTTTTTTTLRATYTSFL